MRRYIILWLRLTEDITQIAFESRFGAIMFSLGKLIRFVFFLGFIVLIGVKTKAIGQYSLWQMVLFYLSYNLVDTLAQFFLREVYRFRNFVVSGTFDYRLLKPVSPLFLSLFGGSDILDVPILILSLGGLLVPISHLGAITIEQSILYLLLLTNGFFVALAFHIFVLGIGILTTEVDNTILLYRDLTQMGRLPIDIYKEPLRGLITFIIPVGIMMTFPAKALMGLLSIDLVLISLVLGVVFLFVSLRFWGFALRHYASASS